MVIIPDLPFAEYRESYKAIAEKHGLHMIMLITPETSEERVRMIDENTNGFIYMVSSASVTGAKSAFSDENLAYFRRINSMQLKNPRLIGFGISNKVTFDAACQEASGAIIGSKFVSLLGSEDSIEGLRIDQHPLTNIYALRRRDGAYHPNAVVHIAVG